MTYQSPKINEYKDEPVYAGACGDYNSNCGSSIHRKGATGACGDYNSNCGSSIHRNTGNAGCGDFNTNCGSKIHRK